MFLSQKKKKNFRQARHKRARNLILMKNFCFKNCGDGALMSFTLSYWKFSMKIIFFFIKLFSAEHTTRSYFLNNSLHVNWWEMFHLRVFLSAKDNIFSECRGSPLKEHGEKHQKCDAGSVKKPKKWSTLNYLIQRLYK